jgi:hypothetical protein
MLGTGTTCSTYAIVREHCWSVDVDRKDDRRTEKLF